MFSREPKPPCEERFALLFDCWKERLYGYVLALTHSRYAAEEVTQEIFLKLWLARNELHLIGNEEAYLFTTARNKVLNYFRKAGNGRQLINGLQATTCTVSNNVEEHLQVIENGKLIQEAVTRLSPQRKQVFHLSRDLGLNHEQIAKEMKLSPNTVKNHLVHALRFIRTYMENNQWILLLLIVLEKK